MQILLVFPLTTPYGVGGVGLGALTPVFVLIFNTIGWSIPAYAYFRLNGEAPHIPWTFKLCSSAYAPTALPIR